MKIIILLSSFFLSTAFGQVREAVQVLSDGVYPEISCEDCSDKVNCPQKIVEELRAGNLTFLGRDLLPGSDQNRSCVFRSASAYVIYRNCMGNKREAPATSISVIPFTGGMIDFYIENSSAMTTPISTMSRSQYDSTWRVSFSPTAAPGQLDLNGVKTYLRNNITPRSGCYVGSSMGAQDMNQRGACYGGYSNPQWLGDAEAFWRNPGAQWSSTLQQLRQKVISSY